jgi:FHA domain
MDRSDENRRRPRDLKALMDAGRTGMPFVHWYDSTDELRILMLSPERTRVTIGRREQSDISLPWDPEVSRAHALLEPVGEEWTVVDDGLSRNGSWVSGGRVHGRHRLHDKDKMCFGNTYVVYHAPSHDSVSTARAHGSPNAVPLTERKRKMLIALCRPIVDESSATPATNPQIAEELHLSVDAVKSTLRELFDQFGLGALPQNEKRSRLVSIVLDNKILLRRDF